MTGHGFSRASESWNRYPRAVHRAVVPLHWSHEVPPLNAFHSPVLPYGRGRSYGDTCLNAGGVLLDTRGLSRFIGFDVEQGLVRCESGVTLGEILAVSVPRGWFLPVTPGTQHVTVGGAIAHDVHGKDHHMMGTFGCHVTRFELLRSGGERMVCGADQNRDLYRATIGGMGLTGLILWAEVQLVRVSGPLMVVRSEPFRELDQFWILSESADAAWPYTVGWLDGLGWQRGVIRGLLLKGDHVARGRSLGHDGRSPLPVAFEPPVSVVNTLSTSVLNALYYHWHAWRRGPRIVSYDRFLFPLDGVDQWNRLYGGAGFIQYQCVVPPPAAAETVGTLLSRIAEAGEPVFLVVLKRFGDRRSPGLLSFPRPGTTLSADLPFRGTPTLQLLDALDELVIAAGGAVYPAKDARMSASTFRASFPEWSTFGRWVDPGFSSSFWRRVGGEAGERGSGRGRTRNSDA